MLILSEWMFRHALGIKLDHALGYLERFTQTADVVHLHNAWYLFGSHNHELSLLSFINIYNLC